MNVSGSAPIEGGGVSLRIVDLLEKYGVPIPIGFLAKELGRRPERLLEDLSLLEAKGVVKINQEQGTATLFEAKKSPLTSLFSWVSGSQ